VDTPEPQLVQPVEAFKQIGRRFQGVPLFGQNLYAGGRWRGLAGLPEGARGRTEEKIPYPLFKSRSGHFLGAEEQEGAAGGVVAFEESGRRWFLCRKTTFAGRSVAQDIQGAQDRLQAFTGEAAGSEDASLAAGQVQHRGLQPYTAGPAV
jgi:hypothetical protein